MFASISLKEICTPNPTCVSPETRLTEVLDLMRSHAISSIIVAEDNKPVGIFTERDALRIIPSGKNPDTTQVREAMHSPPVVAPMHLDFFEAYHLCAQKNIRHLIVVDEAGNLFGIATDTDFMKVLGVEVISGMDKVENMMGSTVSLPPYTHLNQAIETMLTHKTTAVVVVDAGNPVGILTERDIVRLGRTEADGSQPIACLMTAPVISIQAGKSIYLGIELMRERHIRTLPVVDHAGVYLGLLTEHDVVQRIESKYVSVLTSIIRRQADDIERIRHELSEKHVLSAVLHESLGVALIVADPGGIIHYMNPAAASWFDITPEAAPGLELLTLFREARMATDDLKHAFAAARHGNSHEYILAHREGASEIELHVRIAPIQDQHGQFLGIVQTTQDVTAQKRSERKLKQAASIFENTIEGVIITDADVNILSVNPAFTNITGYTEDEVRGKNPRVLSSGRQDRCFYTEMWNALSTDGYWQGEIWNRRKNGETYAEWLTISRIQDSDGNPKNYIAVFADITSSKQTDADFEYLAHHDPLTQLPNRLLFNARLTHSLARASRTGGMVALLMIDLDGFKPINDRFGHPAGDHVLEITAARLKLNTRSEDTAARLGGDEFVVVLEELNSTHDAIDVAHKLIHELAKPIPLGHHSVAVTASVGIAFSTQDMNDPKELLQNADIALYEAKSAGKNTFRIFNSVIE